MTRLSILKLQNLKSKLIYGNSKSGIILSSINLFSNYVLPTNESPIITNLKGKSIFNFLIAS